MRSTCRGLLAAAALFAAGCHSSTSPTTTTTDTSTTTTTTPTYILAVTGTSILTGLRERSQLIAIITNDDGTTQDVTKSSTWVTSDPSVATVTSNGVITTTAPGSAHITAFYQTTNAGFDIAVAPVTTTFDGVLQGSDGRNGTFRLIIRGATDPTINIVSSEVSGTITFGGEATTVTGFFESLTGAISFAGVERAYRFSGVVANGVLNASFTGPDEVSGVVASTSVTIT
jgi:Big-like domain-containing protein